MAFARFVRFYRVSPSEALETPSRRFFALLKAADRLEAREALLALSVATNPQLSKDQDRLWDDLRERAAQPVNLEAEYRKGRAFLESKFGKGGKK